MFLKKLTQEERIKLRAQRKESQLIRNRAKQRGFVYVVNPPEIPKVAFGSSLERVTLPLRGPCLTSFMRQHQGDVFLSPGPATRVDERNLLEIKWPSKLGYSAFASKAPRLLGPSNANMPCVGSYDVETRNPFRNAAKPFNIGAARKDKERFLTPGPSTYPHHVERPKLRISSAFGSRRKILPAIGVICSPLNVAKCHKCEQIPQGDYWHDFNTELDLCRPCMHKIEHDLKKCSATELQRLRLRREFSDYVRVRYCDFYHDHGGTMAAVQILPQLIYKMKIEKENYLSLYM
ncbi:uncharacterized protein LOC131805580 isoform X1 [Musca domestica]|uniref:Uncharacterized protein LOC131805580 isoform X1 n=1 Tax=Musca domestica TaxID=7370 RepID=A0ABM3VGF0_MUSDO|nr:uncharacterized protein LOC131805580 isoform X1 [Musca domestica]